MIMRKKIVIALFALIGLFAIGMTAHEVLSGKEDLQNTFFRGALLVASSIIGILKVCTVQSSNALQSIASVEQQFKKELKNAFVGAENAALRSRLLKAAQLYAGNRNRKAQKLLLGLKDACQTSSDHRAVYMFLALLCAEAGLNSAATEHYNHLLRHDPSCSTAWSNLGLLHRKDGRYQEALACYSNALEQDPQNAYAYNNMATTYFAMGEYELAIEHAKTALSLKGDLFQASNAACLASMMMGLEEDCEHYYQISITNGADPHSLQQTIRNIQSRPAYAFALPECPAEVRAAMIDFVRLTTKPFLRACLPASGTNSRFGGNPVKEIPLDENGHPLRLAALIDCSEVVGMPDFPTEGVLQFFVADTPTYGACFDDPTKQTGFRVIYTPERFDLTAELPQPPASEHFPIHGSYPLLLALSMAPMTDEDYRFEETVNQLLSARGLSQLRELDGAVISQICDHVHSEGHRMGGYPHFTQHDPRQDNAALQRFDTLLLQIDTHNIDGDNKIEIGNGGVMNFFIPRENLRRLDFSEVLYWCETSKID